MASESNLNTAAQDPDGSPRRVLTLFDCVCIIVGTIVGAGIFEMPAVVAANVSSIFWLVTAWTLGGFVALTGALCFAELTTTYPDRGGDYGYLKRGYHRQVGFAFSWAAFWIIRPGNIGAMAMIFGKFSGQALGNSVPPVFWAVTSVVVITATNLLGVRIGKTTQNVLTTVKVVGILLLVGAAFSLTGEQNPTRSIAPQPTPHLTETLEIDTPESASSDEAVLKSTASGTTDESIRPPESSWNSFWLAMVFVMFTFGGWNDIAFVASEVRDPRTNLLRSLVIGTLGVLGIYLLVNFAILHGLGFASMSTLGSQWQNPTTLLVEEKMGQQGGKLFAMLVGVSCLGAINAMIFTSPRIYWATAIDYPALGWLAGSEEQRRAGGWWRAMLLQGVVTILFIVTFGWRGDGIDKIVAATAPYFWFFLSLTVISLMVSRVRYRGKFHGYRVPLYPLLPIFFVTACVMMMVQAWRYTLAADLWQPTLLIGFWVLAGVGLSFVLKQGRPGSSNVPL